jgi:elongation factor G
MAKSEIGITHNIGISAHIDSGKTTLTERILYYTGRIHKIEEVRGGGDGATMDHMELEKEKGITITSAATTVHWKDQKINIIDTPGHVDFTVEVERSLRVLDGAILVLCGVAGVQSQSITVDRQMKRYRVPCLAFINKLDRTGADPYQVTSDLCTKLKHNAVMMQIPIGLEGNLKGVVDLVTMRGYIFEGEKGEKIVECDIPDDLKAKAEEKRLEMLEAVSMFDEQMMEDLLEEKEIPVATINAAIKKGVLSLQLTPVYMGSAFKNTGVQKLCDAIVQFLPTPLEAERMKAKDVKDETQEMKLEPDPSKPTVALAFKITDDEFGQLTYTRIYQGKIEKGMTLINQRTRQKIRVGRLIRMHANSRENIDSADAGDIIAMIGVDCASGDTFCGEGIAVTCESMFVPTPVISYSISCKDNQDVEKMGKALARFLKEDPTFKVHTDEESGETIISGMGELHLDIYVERMAREYKVQVQVGPPQVNYREAITRKVEFNYTHKKQTGGSGQFAQVSGDIEPMDANEDTDELIEFNNLVKGGNIPNEFISACQKGFEDVMNEGPLAAFPVVSVRVNLRDGKYHEVDSSDMAFRICSRQAMRQAIRSGNPQILEPIMKVEVETPDEYQGTVIGDLSSRRGIIGGMDSKGDLCVVSASVPLAEMFGYSTAVRSLTAGKATYSMEFEKYMAVTANVQQDVIKARSQKVKSDDD